MICLLFLFLDASSQEPSLPSPDVPTEFYRPPDSAVTLGLPASMLGMLSFLSVIGFPLLGPVCGSICLFQSHFGGLCLLIAS